MRYGCGETIASDGGNGGTRLRPRRLRNRQHRLPLFDAIPNGPSATASFHFKYLGTEFTRTYVPWYIYTPHGVLKSLSVINHSSRDVLIALKAASCTLR